MLLRLTCHQLSVLTVGEKKKKTTARACAPLPKSPTLRPGRWRGTGLLEAPPSAGARSRGQGGPHRRRAGEAPLRSAERARPQGRRRSRPVEGAPGGGRAARPGPSPDPGLPSAGCLAHPRASGAAGPLRPTPPRLPRAGASASSTAAASARSRISPLLPAL